MVTSGPLSDHLHEWEVSGTSHRARRIARRHRHDPFRRGDLSRTVARRMVFGETGNTVRRIVMTRFFMHSSPDLLTGCSGAFWRVVIASHERGNSLAGPSFHLAG